MIMIRQRMPWPHWSGEAGNVCCPLIRPLAPSCPLLSLISMVLLWAICQVRTEAFDSREECKSCHFESGKKKGSDIKNIYILEHHGQRIQTVTSC